MAIFIAFAGHAESADYIITSDTLDGGGGAGSSANYSQPRSSIGQPFVFGTYSSSNYIDNAVIYASVSDTAPSDAVPPTDTTDGTSGSKNVGCFIATAAYGSYLDPHVEVLRDFRDNYLIADFGMRIADHEFTIPNIPGKAFVSLYYRTSPPIADSISRHESLRTATRFALTPLVYGLKYPMAAGALLIGSAGFAIAKRKRKKIRAA